MKRKILILAPHFTPAVKGGGPIQSVRNIISVLGDEFDFYVLTADRDLGDSQPFRKVQTDTWIETSGARVFYTDLQQLTPKRLTRIIEYVDPEVLYLNSFFNFKLSIIPAVLKKLGKLNQIKLILAPRGEFSPGALQLKRHKKRIFIFLARFLRLHKGVIWHATAEEERKQIKAQFGTSTNCVIASNLAGSPDRHFVVEKIEKQENDLRVIFISRVHPKKNLKYAIDILKFLPSRVIFSVFGPIEDERYWQECLALAKTLPENITFSYEGALMHHEVNEAFQKHHVFLFPTLGENFGHVIAESFLAGCPVITSDQTPWIGLEEQKVGWDIPLSDKDMFIHALREIANMDGSEYRALSSRAHEYGVEKLNQGGDIEAYKIMFGT